jgi:lipopolysaccharide transport system permease protein
LDKALAQVPSTVEQPRVTPSLVIDQTATGLRQGLRDVWAYRELLYFLTWRDLKVRYRQTALGASWAILQPLTTMVIFSVVFGGLANLPSDGVPYPLFSFTALLPWNLFAGAVSRVTASVVGQANLINKVYFPRVLIPLSGTASALVDFACSFVILLAIMGYYGYLPTWRLIALPGLLLLAMGAALGIGLWFAALNVRYRDVTYVVPFLVQIWLYASPVAYSSRLVTERLGDWAWLYGLNPLAGIVDGFRWAVLGAGAFPAGLVGTSFVTVVLLLLGGWAYFRRTEDSFADIV